jgi:hypothetical protein
VCGVLRAIEKGDVAMAMTKEKCPVCSDEMGSNPKTVKVGTKNMKVCCEECAEKAKANPAKYAATATV